MIGLSVVLSLLCGKTGLAAENENVQYYKMLSAVEYSGKKQFRNQIETLFTVRKQPLSDDKTQYFISSSDYELSEKFEQMLEFTKASGVVSFDNNGGHIVFQRLAKLSVALTEAQLATINARADYEAVQSMASEPAKIKQFAVAQPNIGIRISVNNTETQLRSELKDLEVELKNVRYFCTEEHPSVQAIHAKIDHTK